MGRETHFGLEIGVIPVGVVLLGLLMMLNSL